MGIDRIDRNDRGELDDIVISDIETLHIEWMSGKHLWMGVQIKGKEEIMHLNIFSKRKVKMNLLDVSNYPEWKEYLYDR